VNVRVISGSAERPARKARFVEAREMISSDSVGVSHGMGDEIKCVSHGV